MRTRRLRSETGQVIGVAVVVLISMLGMTALVLDVGSWFRDKRDLQSTADAAALAGAQALPESTAEAQALANSYASKNNGPNPAVSFRTTVVASDTIRVEMERPAPGFFAQVFGVDTVTIGARAMARAGNPSEARYAAPIAVDEKHPLLGCKPLPCFNEATELDLDKVGPGAFRLLNLDGSRGGTGGDTLAAWILKGYDGYMPLGVYYSDPGAKFNDSKVRAALDVRLGTEMLFPVYRTIREQGANLEYEVIGWVGYVVTSYRISGSKNNKLYGYFTRVIWEGVAGASASAPDFGARAVELIE